MRFWISRNADSPVREQLATQVILGILGEDLRPGQRLPSTREFARRFRVHPNTVSAAYRRLARDRWVEFRRGSGVYVRKNKPDASPSAMRALDTLVADLLRSARSVGVPLSAVRAHIRRWLAMQPPDHFLLIEPDEELREILVLEIQQRVGFPVVGAGWDACKTPELLASAIPLALADKAQSARKLLPARCDLIVLPIRSVPHSLSLWIPAPPDALVAIASRWPGFLKMARAVLAAAGIPRDALLFRDARAADWLRGLKQAAAVVCDSATASRIPKGPRVITFPLLADSSFDELRKLERFVSDPISPRV